MLNIEICKRHCDKYGTVLTAVEGKMYWMIYCKHVIPKRECFRKMDK